MKAETKDVIVKGQRFEDYRNKAPKLIADLERFIAKGDNELENLFGTKSQRSRRQELIELEDTLIDLRVIEYGMQRGNEQVLSQREARTWLSRFMSESYIANHSYEPAQRLMESLIEVDPSDKPYTDLPLDSDSIKVKLPGRLRASLDALSQIDCFPSTPTIQLYAQIMQSRFMSEPNPYKKAEGEAYLKAAKIHIERGREEQGVDYLNKAHKRDPENGEINYTIAKYLVDSAEQISLGVLKNALPYAQKAFEVEPSRSDFKQFYKTLIRYKDVIDADSEAEIAIR